MGGDHAPRKWLRLRHPNTGDAPRGEVEVRPIPLMRSFRSYMYHGLTALCRDTL